MNWTNAECGAPRYYAGQVVKQAASGVMLKLLVLTEEDLNGLLMSAMLALLPQL